jgi:NADPH:quinone reductase-like Zn-dependent oxidoreductase
MRAAFFRRHGEADVMEVGEAPTPEPGPGEVQVQVRAVALNHIDLWMRRGLPALKIALPHISGGDAVGTIAAWGAGVAGLREGDPVLVNPGLSCGRCARCWGGQDNLCADFRMLGEHTDGAMAERVVVPVANLVPVPAACLADGPDALVALAALPISFITAWHMLVDRAAVRPGETVLVLGAGSGVGVAATQIAKLFGARVIAAASGARKLAGARALGADATVDYVDEELVAAVKRLTDRRGADIVVEHTGAATFAKSVVSCARGGRIVTCGATAGHEAVLNLRHVFWRQLSILGSTLAPKARLFDILDRVANRQLRPVVDRTLPLESIVQAHLALESRDVFGKIVLTL